MAKVIQPKWSQKYKCTGKGNGERGCQKMISVTEENVYETQSYYGKNVVRHSTICCPNCGKETDIDLPLGITIKGERPSKGERKRIGLLNQGR
jgi:hypothetical protein